jgi:serine/threonine protein kinase
LVLRECTRAGVDLTSKEAAEARDVLPPAYSAPGSSTDADGVVHSRAKPYLKDPPLNDLPLESFDLRVIYERGRTGFEDDKEFPIAVGTVIAGRYKVTEFLGEAAFSRAVQAIDLKHNMHVCVKIIRNSKDFFDQSLDEVKLLHYINTGGDPDENCVVQLYDFFYFKEHMFLICELLRDNLYEFSKYNREHEAERYFTLPRLQSVTSQVLRALRFVHSLGLIHCDLKPENILIKSYSRCEVKVIDFGSSCFLTDNLTSYVQSRCYRAPEAILGCRYDGRIDIWSLGAIVAELATGSVLFANETVPGMLARIASIVGPFPPRMLREGRHSCRFFTKYGVLYEQFQPDAEEAAHPSRVGPDGKPLLISTLYFAQPTQLEHLVGFDDPDYVDFIRQCLTIDPTLRPTAEELLRHPFMTKSYQ